MSYVKFKKGTSDVYEVIDKDEDTFYILTDNDEVYFGKIKLSGSSDDHVNDLIDAKLGVIENGSY